MNSRQLIRFVVLSVEAMPDHEVARLKHRPSARQRGGKVRKMRLAECIVAREKDFGTNDTQFSVITHLGNVLREGDIALGYELTAATPVYSLGRYRYDLSRANWTHDCEEVEHLPDVILVRKHYPTKGERKWMLKQLEVQERHNHSSGLSGASKKNADAEEDMEAEYEEFLQELEADREMRKHVNLYKKPKKLYKMKGERLDDALEHVPETTTAAEDEDEVEDEDENMVQLDELLDDLVVSDTIDELIHTNQLSVAVTGKPEEGTTASTSASFDPQQYEGATFKFL